MDNTEYNNLVNELNEHSFRYYVLNDPIITDSEYDEKYNHLKEIEALHKEFVTPHSPTQRVGAEVSTGFKKVAREKPMLSLDNVFSEDELQKWLDKTGADRFVLEPKYDGLAVELEYIGGNLVQATTRGDGITGEDITQNVRVIKNVPGRLLDYKEDAPGSKRVIRGEVVFPKEDFDQYNQERTTQGKKAFMNARNAAAGSLKLLDHREVAKRPLKFLAYSLEAEGLESISLSQRRALLKTFGFETINVSNSVIASFKKADVLSLVKELQEIRSTLPVDIDGCVIKVDNPQLCVKLGETSHAPRWAIAFKFPAQQRTSVIMDIVCQVGRTGTVTPVAKIAPVIVGGVTITSVTLHNEDQIKAKDIRLGDTVVVERAGDVIPSIVKVVIEKRPNLSKSWSMPNNCPVCSEPLQNTPGKVGFFCKNALCLSRLENLVKHACSNQCFNIENLGDKLIKNLVAEGKIKSVADLFILTEKDLIVLDRVGPKLASKIINNIAKSKSVPFCNVITSLNIPGVGSSNAKVLATSFKNIHSLLKATPAEIARLEGFGKTLSTAVSSYLCTESVQSLISSLLSVGVVISYPKAHESVLPELVNTKIVITGSFDYPRVKVKKLLESQGVKVSSSISKNTDYLLCGEKPGSKLKKATQQGVNILDAKHDLFKIIMEKVNEI